MRALSAVFLIAFYMSIPIAAHAETPDHGTPSALSQCKATSLKCLLDATAAEAQAIEEPRWRDQILRDLVMRYADAGYARNALPLIPQLQNGDTRAMAIRAAGMGLAKHSDDKSKDSDSAYFTQLKGLADTIEHEGARAIAYTYIAMAQAMAGLDEEATVTAKNMSNSALRNKAFAENAEIQAEREDKKAALASISHIDDAAFRDKAYSITADIFIKQGRFEDALDMAAHITNSYKLTRILLDLTGAQIHAEAHAATP